MSAFFISRLKKISALLGLNEKRCAICLEPFSPRALTENPLFPSSLLCSSCQEELPPSRLLVCPKCGLPLYSEVMEKNNGLFCCPVCARNPPPWSGMAYYGFHAGKLRDAILALKYSGSLRLTGLFSDLLLESSKCLPAPDLIVPVPLSLPRLKIRGFNQALEIGKRLAGSVGAPVSSKALVRIKDNLPQEGLSAAQRRENIRGVFQGGEEVGGASVWLVDDVMTTGATLEECSRALLGKGAKKVSLLFIARAL